MAATGYSPIQLYYSTTASAAPTAGNLASGELAINITDGKLYYKDNAGAVQLLSTSTTANGTANGVLYLNGSKVATSGSALTFDNSNLFTLSTSTPVFRLTPSVNTALQGIEFGSAVVTDAFIKQQPSSGEFRISSGRSAGWGGFTSFYIDTVEAMRLNSTGLGIGTSSPSTKLTVAGDSLLSVASGNIGYGWLSGTTNYSLYLNAADNSLRFYSSVGTAGDKLIMSSAGNLGLGVTPSSWNSTYRGFEIGKVGNGVYGWSGGGLTGLVAGAYIDSAYNWKYALSSQAIGKYEITETGKHIWSLAASGTAGNTVSFTSAMTLDASGNLLVGTTDTSGANTTGFEFFYGSGSSRLYLGHVTGTVTGTYYHAFNYAGTTIGSITQSGTTAVLYNVTSDQRLKENIQNADSASVLIDSLQVRKFDWKSDGNHQRYGFVAQELVTVAPEAVHQPADPEEMMAVDYSKLVPMLVKEIQSLRKRLADAGIA